MTAFILSDIYESLINLIDNRYFKIAIIVLIVGSIILGNLSHFLRLFQKNTSKPSNEEKKTSSTPFERAEREQVLFKKSQNKENIFIDDDNQREKLATILKNHSIVCVHGPAGIGKTTIVDEVRYTKLQEHFVLNFRVDLEDVHAPDSLEELNIVSSFERAKLRFLSGVGALGQNAELSKIAYGFQQKTLLFIDNYEQIQAIEELDLIIRKELIAPFVENPFISIVFTSRIKMKSDTKNFEVAALENAKGVNGMSSIDLANHFPAIRLFFKEHNRFAANNNLEKKEFNSEECETVIKLCDLVSCLPLGIQLIASRSCEYSLEKISKSFQAACQEERPMGWNSFNERHKSLFNAFYWSFNLLTAEEKNLCAHLSLFKNGFFEKSIPFWDTFENSDKVRKALKKLNEHSILRKSTHSDQVRYELYVFASEMLIAGIKERKFKFNQEFLIKVSHIYNTYLDKAIDQIFDKQETVFDYSELIEDIRLDIENIKYFSNQLLEIGFSNLAAQMLCGLEKILYEVGPYVLLKDSFDELRQTNQLEPIDSAKVNLSYAKILKSTPEREKSWGIAREALDVIKSCKDSKEKFHLIGEAFITLSLLSDVHQRSELLNRFFAEEINFNQSVIGNMHQLKGRQHEVYGEIERAKIEFETALRLLKDYPMQYGKALNYSGLFFWREGFANEARESLFGSIDLYAKFGAKRWIQGFKTNLALLAADTEEFEEGFRFLLEAQTELKKEGPFEWYHINRLAQARLLFKSEHSSKSFTEAELILKDCERIFEDINYGESHVLCLVGLAELYFIQNKFALALETCKKTIQIAEEHNLTRMMRVFRTFCIASLSSAHLNSSTEASVQKELALSLLDSVTGNNWLSYPNTKLLHDQILELDVNAL